MSKANVRITMGVPEFKRLEEYLLSHEDDISYGINDYADLEDLFVGIFDRVPDANNKQLAQDEHK